jgi:putative membrane protein
MKNLMLNSLKAACVITAVTALAVFTARAQAQQTTTGTAGDHAAKSFIKQAFRDNQTEIDLAAIGAAKAQNADLKALCEQLQKDHREANQELQSIAQKYGVAEEQTTRSEREVNKFEKETSGPEFDKQFATEMLKSHRKGIAKFENAAAKLQEADVKQYAEKMLPKLREHFQQTEKVARAVGVDQSTISSIVNETPGAVGGASDTHESDAGVGSRDKTDKDAGARQPDQTTPPPQP